MDDYTRDHSQLPPVIEHVVVCDIQTNTWPGGPCMEDSTLPVSSLSPVISQLKCPLHCSGGGKDVGEVVKYQNYGRFYRRLRTRKKEPCVSLLQPATLS